MHDIGNLQLGLFSLLILCIITTNIPRGKSGYSPDQRLFYWMLSVIAALLVLDILYLAVNGKEGRIEYYVNLISCSLSFMLQTILCFFWCLYTRFQLTGDMKKAKENLSFLLMPSVINGALVIANFWFPLYFFIDASNRYQRGSFFYLAFVLTLFQYLYAMIYTVSRRKTCERRIFLSLLIFPLPTFFGSLIQMQNNYMLIWPGAVLSLLLIYLNIQKNEMYTDYLTGLYNRRFLDMHLSEYLKNKGKAVQVGVLMLDVDRFKRINDMYGHAAGDQALVEAAALIKQSVGRRGLVARYGGDEYVVVVPRAHIDEMEAISREIEQNVRQYYSSEERPYSVALSMGYELFDCGRKITPKEVFDRIDRRMYEQKQQYATACPHGK